MRTFRRRGKQYRKQPVFSELIGGRIRANLEPVNEKKIESHAVTKPIGP